MADSIQGEMGDATTVQQSSRRRAFWQVAKKAALAVLFSTILLIPRLRRLRRRPRLWNLLRLLAVALGTWLVWRFARATAGTSSLLGSVVLFAFAALVPPRPWRPTPEDRARELDALVVLNGGALASLNGGKPVTGVRLLVAAEHLTVMDEHAHTLLEIPVSSIRRIEANARLANGAQAEEGAPWKLEIAWEAEGAQKAEFLFEGFFAEHLARVAETNLRGVVRKSLPILKA